MQVTYPGAEQEADDEVIDQRIQLKRNLSDLSVDAAVTDEDYLAGLQISPIGSRND
jgi:hypothetical protein